MARDLPPFGASEAEYEAWARQEVARWRGQMLKAPNLLDKTTRGVQQKINQVIPEQVHKTATAVIEQMTRAILTGSNVVTAAPSFTPRHSTSWQFTAIPASARRAR